MDFSVKKTTIGKKLFLSISILTVIMALISFSKHPNIAKDFMKIAASQTGQEIMRKYGFLE
jgi:ABC-type molybdate transport system substrate-binding protein